MKKEVWNEKVDSRSIGSRGDYEGQKFYYGKARR